MLTNNGKIVTIPTKCVSFSWHQVAQAFWNRYPNPHSKHVLSEDVLSRKIIEDSDGPKLHTIRLLTKTNPIPKWGEKFKLVPSSQCTVTIIEESIIDPIKKIINTTTKNIGLTRLMYVEEKASYSFQDKNHCIIDRSAIIKSSIFGLSRPLQAFGCEKFKHSAAKSTKGLEFVLNKLFNPETIPNLSATEKFKQSATEKAQKAKEQVQRVVASNTT